MRYILLVLLFFSCSKDQVKEIIDFTPVDENQMVTIDVKDVGAVGNGVADDWEPLQRAIDSAVKIQGKVYIPAGKYSISKPLMVYRWAGTQYTAATCEIIGEDLMWSGGTGISVIRPQYKDKFAIGVQQGKGVVIRGIYLDGKAVPPAITLDSMYRQTIDQYGDMTVRRSSFSPYAGVVVDPFSGLAPSDGGYPGMTEWYRGPQTRSGSTGCRFEDMTFEGFDVGAITSPNGFTQNAEILTFENIRVVNCRIGIAGSQAQEKQNRIINLGCWGETHTLFSWAQHGARQPGHWYINGVNIAGRVFRLLHRPSGGWFPLFVDNVFAESLGQIGPWYSTSGDAISNSSINFIYPNQVYGYHFAYAQQYGIAFNSVNLRIYGDNTPIVFGAQSDNLLLDRATTYVPPVVGKVQSGLDSVDMGKYSLHRAAIEFPTFFRDGQMIKATFNTRRYAGIKAGDILVAVGPNQMINGMARVAELTGTGFIADYISAHHDQSINNIFYVYRKK